MNACPSPLLPEEHGCNPGNPQVLEKRSAMRTAGGAASLRGVLQEWASHIEESL